MTQLVERRKALLALAALGLSPFATRLATAAGSNRCRYPAPTWASPNIDVHSHISNASDLQVEGFLAKAAAAEMPDFANVLRFFAPILQAAGWACAPGYDAEKRRLERLASLSFAKDDAIDRTITEDWTAGERAFEEGLARELAKPSSADFLNAYDAYRKRVLQAEPIRSAATRELEAFDLQTLKQPEGVRRYAALERGFGGKQLFTFASNFFHYRYVNAQHLLDTYGCKTGNVKLFAIHQLDYDYALGGGHAAPTTLSQQIELFSLIVSKSDGRILPFAAFDPWRMIVEGQPALDRVTHAVEKEGCVGVKLYPPMGFAPYGNAALHPSAWPSIADFGKKLDASLDTFYSWCVGKDVPVLAHANPSWAADPSFIQLGSPENWGLALARHPALRICFAHFGGDGDLKNPTSWSFKFAGLASQYENAYMDCAFFERVLDAADRPALEHDLTQFLSAVSKSVQDKLMYGSDWLLLAMEPHCDDYYDDFEKVAQKVTVSFPDLDQKLFSSNATKYLGLESTGKTSARLHAFHTRRNRMPEWLTHEN